MKLNITLITLLLLSSCSLIHDDYKKEPGVNMILGNTIKHDARKSIIVSSKGKEKTITTGAYSQPTSVDNNFIVMNDNKMIRVDQDLNIKKTTLNNEIIPVNHSRSEVIKTSDGFIMTASGGFTKEEARHYFSPVLKMNENNTSSLLFDYDQNISFSSVCDNKFIGLLTEKNESYYHVLITRNIKNPEEATEHKITSRFHSGEYLSPRVLMCDADNKKSLMFAKKLLRDEEKPLLIVFDYENNTHEVIPLDHDNACSFMLNDSYIIRNSELFYGSYNGVLCRLDLSNFKINRVGQAGIEGNDFSNQWLFTRDNVFLSSMTSEEKLAITRFDYNGNVLKTGLVNYKVPRDYFMKKFVVLDNCLDLSCLTSYEFQEQETFEISEEWNDYLNTLSMENKNKLSRVIKYTNLSKKEYDEHLEEQLARTPGEDGVNHTIIFYHNKLKNEYGIIN